ncbi:hypothetical protein GJAV_G00159840 [Gymnothorax javanicus]|nr:hypothetical protein GJAV_G00159840 [Gymnothorax javanicus]
MRPCCQCWPRYECVLVYVLLTLIVTPLYICLIYQSLLDCQQPAASVPPVSPQLRRDRAFLGRSHNTAAADQEDKKHHSSSSGSRSPCVPFSCLSPEAPPPGL